jgi:ATP-dependent exoDNAse (exonuclease V) alpha subunit
LAGSGRVVLELLSAIERTGARLIEVGDPRQNQPVGAGGLWPRIESAALAASAHIELTRNQRARDPADRRDQAKFRHGQIPEAVQGYEQRSRLHLEGERQAVEDRALDAAQRDRSSGLSTIVVAQTSNRHLDGLNARAQAIRSQHGELGREGVPVPGRPYDLHEGDLVQVRHTFNDRSQAVVRNGTGALVTSVDAGNGVLGLELNDGSRLTMDRAQLTAADLRLAYVQHPFPAQGQTTDTAHLIIGDGTTTEGAYVGITRARERTDLYGVTDAEQTDQVAAVAELLGRSEPEVPSIEIPVARAEVERVRVWPARDMAQVADVQEHDMVSGRAFGREM